MMGAESTRGMLRSKFISEIAVNQKCVQFEKVLNML